MSDQIFIHYYMQERVKKLNCWNLCTTLQAGTQKSSKISEHNSKFYHSATVQLSHRKKNILASQIVFLYVHRTSTADDLSSGPKQIFPPITMCHISICLDCLKYLVYGHELPKWLDPRVLSSKEDKSWADKE